MRSAQASVVEIEKGKRYRVFVEAGRDPRTGERRRFSRRVRGSRKDAERVKVEMLAAIGEPGIARESMTLDGFWRAMYLPNCEERLRPNTVESYADNYRKFLEGPLGAVRIAEVTPAMARRVIDSVDGASKRFEAYKMLRQIMSRAVRWGIVDSNPCDGVDVPKKPKYRPEVLDAQDAAVYLWHFRGTVVEPAVLIALGGGLRRSEICALDWSDVSTDGAVSVSHAITVVNGQPHDGDTKTEFGHRTVHLPAGIAARLNELRRPGEPVCVDAFGQRCHPDVLTRNYIRIRNTLPEGVPRISLKNMRHTSLTLAIDAGVDILAASRRAGHASIAITSAYYVRPHDDVDKATARAIDGILGF